MVLPLLSSGQDIHFSQTTRSFFQINPAFTGAINGNLRAEINWKDQWQSINSSFRTFASSVQGSFGKGNARKPTFFGVGGHAFKDVAGDVQIGNTQVGLSLASFIRIDRNARLSLGVQGNYGVTGLDPSKMQWGSQYNGLNFDPALTNGSGIEFQGFQYTDIAAGIGYWYQKRDGNVIHSAPQDAKFGMSIYHINRPSYSYNNDKSKENRLKRRVNLHGSAVFSTSTEDLYFYPNINIMIQGKQHEVLIGSLWKYRFQSASKTTGFTGELSVTGGMNMRITNVIDALIPQVYVDFYNFSVGMSYDLNVSKLNIASHYRGGFELSIRFTNPDSYIHRNPFRRGISI